MGGTQSWLNCDTTYPETDSTPYRDELENGDPILAVFMFVGTLVGVLLLTVIVHCAIVAVRSCCSRHRKRRHRRKQSKQQQQQQQHLGAANGADSASATVINVAPHLTGDSKPTIRLEGDAESSSISDEDNDDASLTSSSDTSIDSTTARIAAQIAHRRRSRFMTDFHTGHVSDMLSVSPSTSITTEKRDQLRPPVVGLGSHNGGYDNSVFIGRQDFHRGSVENF